MNLATPSSVEQGDQLQSGYVLILIMVYGLILTATRSTFNGFHVFSKKCIMPVLVNYEGYLLETCLSKVSFH